MSLETEAALDRRRLKRSTSFWRAGAILALAAAIGAYAFSGEGRLGLSETHQIARVTIEGMITEDRAQLRMLKRLAEAKHVDGVILVVNSPGGTTTGGEALYGALRELAKDKPVVAQFGTVAASAGYIVGLGTDHIVARGNSITGSIGVLAQWPEFSDLLDKLGIKFNEVKSGVLKAAPSPFAPMTDDARKVMEDTINDGFKWFLSLVKERRGIDPADVPGLKDGRIFSGREALTHKLVDEIGGEAEAKAWLEASPGVDKGLDVVDWKPEPSGRWGLTSSLSSVAGSIAEAATQGVVKSAFGPSAVGAVGLDGLVSVWHP